MMASPQFWPPAAPAEIVGSPSWTSHLFPTLVRLLQPFESNFDVLDFDSAFRVTSFGSLDPACLTANKTTSSPSAQLRRPSMRRSMNPLKCTVDTCTGARACINSHEPKVECRADWAMLGQPCAIMTARHQGSVRGADHPVVGGQNAVPTQCPSGRRSTRNQ